MKRGFIMFLSIAFALIVFLAGCKPAPNESPKKVAEKVTAVSPPLVVGKLEGPDSSLLLFRGWYENEGNVLRWSEGNKPSLDFFADASVEKSKKLLLNAYMNGEQRVTLSLNGKMLYTGQLQGASQSLSIDIPTGVIVSGKNSLTFELPDAKPGSEPDQRIMALGFQSITFE
jgi:hypothetical protein